MSARTIRYLERGSSRAYPDTLRRLAEALALSPAHQEALVAAHAPSVPAPGPASAAPVAIPIPVALSPPQPLVGREQELATLRDRLAASLAGQGGLVLLSGEAGVGKTALAEALCHEAAQQGAQVLVGRCYDLSETPPYGPWTEARSQFPSSPDLPPLPSALHTAAQSPGQFFAEVRDFFAAAAAKQPLVVLLDDLQWADPASLDLLRFLARALRSLSVLVLVSYRPNEVIRHHPLSPLLPLLVREAHAIRLAIPPLSAAALQALVRARYALVATDEKRLVTYLARRSDGNALFATELLHALEEAGALVPGGTMAGDLEHVAVPMLLRQVIESRVVRLGAEAEELLGIAAVVGQEVPLDIWARVAAADDETVEEVAERALAAGLFVKTRGEEHVGFAHALIREALYEGIPALRRRRIHRAAGEALAALEDAAPGVVAYHFQQAGDARATEWLARAAWRAYRSLAYATARARFEVALPHLEGTERARGLLALASLDRLREQGVRYAKEADATARAAGDTVLAALAQFRLGSILSYRGLVGQALQEMEAAERVLEAVPDDALPDFYGLVGLTLGRAYRRGYRASTLGYSGRWHEVFAVLGEAPETVLAHLGNLPTNGAIAVWSSCILRGRPADARQVATAILTSLATRKDELPLLASQINVGVMLMIPFLLDDRETRQRYEAELVEITRRVEEAVGAVPPFLNYCPLLIVTGKWTEARALWAQRGDAALTVEPTMNLPYVGAMTRAQGNREEAWALVHEGLPDGPQTEPGTTHFTAVDLYYLAARLALDAGDPALARQWLESHARWFAWAGEEVRWGRANGCLAWAEYHQAIGAREEALWHAERALAKATAPRQPLMLLASHRLLGDLLGEAGRDDEARAHLDIALALADACGAPYERALTLLAMAAVRARAGDDQTARELLEEAQTICTVLGARVTLASAARLAQRLTKG